MDTMEGSNNEGIIPYANNTLGALVWVRRRNGSWWPGRILAPEELPGAHLLSPRTGTPVKLLGRADGSVDWYNIEKSRRVKAFRCGEFDECIEKARSLASALSKKREKYARREDAILHALELEKELVQQTQLHAEMLSMGINQEQLSNFISEGSLLYGDMCVIDFQKSRMGPCASIDVGDASLDSMFSLHGHRKFLDVEWDDDFSDSLPPHMRGLHDWGVGIVDPEVASWSSAYDQFSHALVIEEKKKAANIIDGMAPPNSVKSLKKKRFSPSQPLEDESAYKKQKTIPGPSTNYNGDFGDGAFKLGSNFYFSPTFSGKNGSASHVHHKEEKITDRLDKVPIKYKASKGWSKSEVWEASLIESRCRNEMLSFLPFRDRPWLSFSDHQKPGCCSGDSQMEVAASSAAGSAFVDLLLQGGPVSRCSVSPEAINDPSTEVESTNLGSSAPSSSFQTWPSCNYTGLISEKVMHEVGSRRQSTSTNPTDGPEYWSEAPVLSNASVMYSDHSNRLLDNMFSVKGRAFDAEGPFVARNDLDANTITFSRHCLSPVAEEDAREGSFSGEDEADSFQWIPGSSLSSPEAIVVCGTNGHLMQESLLDNESNCSKESMDVPLENRVFVDDEYSDDKSGICVAAEIGSVGEECGDMVYEQSLSRWRMKGRRMARTHCRMQLPSAGVLDRRLEDNGEEVRMAAPHAVKTVGKRSRRPRRPFALTSCSEGEEDLRPTAQLSSKVGAHRATKAQVSQATSTYWFDVPIDFQDGTFQPLVSIMSELFGKHIVGYSVPVEKIVNRSEEGLAYAVEEGRRRNSAASLQKPAWRTARRRTAMQRIPRPCSIVVSLNHDREDVSQGSLGNDRNRGLRKKGPQCGSSLVERMQHEKKLASLPQKTRMLSSIAVQSSDKSSEPICSKVRDAAPLVTCVPVNVIFNRIREVLYRGSNNAPSDCDRKM